MLIVKARGRACALPLTEVVETMRPLPVEPLPDMPGFVLGLAVIRGLPTPVLDLGALMGAPPQPIVEPHKGDRFITVRSGDRDIALAVDGVFGVHRLDLRELRNLPALLRDSLPEYIQVLGALDRELLTVLHAGKLLSPPLAAQFDAAVAGAD